MTAIPWKAATWPRPKQPTLMQSLTMAQRMENYWLSCWMDSLKVDVRGNRHYGKQFDDVRQWTNDGEPTAGRMQVGAEIHIAFPEHLTVKASPQMPRPEVLAPITMHWVDGWPV